jgi:hypothetical protein
MMCLHWVLGLPNTVAAVAMTHQTRIFTMRLESFVLAIGLAFLTAFAPAQAQSKKPNILVIWGDDIGEFNISANNLGQMGYKTPNIDSLATGPMTAASRHCDTTTGDDLPAAELQGREGLGNSL